MGRFSSDPPMDGALMRKTLSILVVVAVAGCGDPETSDDRGYTKAPLETPGLLVTGEPESAVDVELVLEPGLTGAVGAETEERAGAGAAGTEAPSAEEAELAPGVTQEQFDEGEQLFAGQGGCQACHGPGGSGSQLAPDLTDDEWLHVPAPEVDALAEVIRSGVAQPVEYAAPMPAMGGASLSEDQVQALAAYVASMAGS